MARILTIEASDDGKLTYKMTKPAIKKLEQARDVLEALACAIPDADDEQKVGDAMTAINTVLDVMAAEPDDAEPAKGEEDDGEVDPARNAGDGTAA